jgi:rod shape-determining protein MreD
VIWSIRAAALVFLMMLVQVSALGGADIGGVEPDVLFVTVVLVAWNRGSVAGAWAGFVGGLLVDVATLGHLGVSSLLLLLAGYWAGRYGETTGRGRAFAPYLTVLVLGTAYAVGAYGLAALLGESVDAGHALGLAVPVALLDTAIALLLHRPIRWALGRPARAVVPQEVEIVG